MKRAILLAALCAPLGACAPNPEELLDAIGRNYSHCERHITYSAGVGILSPGVSISGSVNCAPHAVAAPAADPE